MIWIYIIFKARFAFDSCVQAFDMVDGYEGEASLTDLEHAIAPGTLAVVLGPFGDGEPAF